MYQRNGRKIQLLEEELNKENFLKIDISLPILKLEKLQSHRLFESAKEVFAKLGGQNFELPKDIGYHLEYQDLLIQYDDELHFNRYRKISLEDKMYEDLKGIKLFEFKNYCRLKERECLKAGLSNGNWHNSEAERLFGKSEEEGDLSLERRGSAAWKFRAWKDYIQDISGLILGFKVIRVSAYDKIMVNGKLQEMDRLLASSNTRNYSYIAKNLVRRIINVKGS